MADAGSGDRLALCLHGFPELAFCGGTNDRPLADPGYRVLAPDQRGYGGTDRPAGVADYAWTSWRPT